MKAEIGTRFGKLVVIEKTKVLIKDKRKDYFATASICKCDCGRITQSIRDNSLLTASTKSCGCLQKETASNRKHNMHKTKIYSSWSHMKARCYNKKNTRYKNYGGRGIVVCDKWQTFEGFYEDMGPTYKEGLTIERIDTNGNYCKENCTWASVKAQNNNTSRNLLWLYDGKWITSAEFCKILKIKPYSLSVNNHYGKKYKHKRLYDGDVCL
jgi:hypothetical protein